MPEFLRSVPELTALLEPLAGKHLRVESRGRGEALVDCYDARMAEEVRRKCMLPQSKNGDSIRKECIVYVGWICSCARNL